MLPLCSATLQVNDPYRYIETIGERSDFRPLHTYCEQVPLRFDHVTLRRYRLAHLTAAPFDQHPNHVANEVFAKALIGELRRSLLPRGEALNPGLRTEPSQAQAVGDPDRSSGERPHLHESRPPWLSLDPCGSPA